MIEREVRVRFKDSDGEFLLTRMDEQVTVRAIGFRKDQRDPDGPFTCSVQQMWKIVDEIQAALPKRPVFRGDSGSGRPVETL